MILGQARPAAAKLELLCIGTGARLSQLSISNSGDADTNVTVILVPAGQSATPRTGSAQDFVAETTIVTKTTYMLLDSPMSLGAGELVYCRSANGAVVFTAIAE